MTGGLQWLKQSFEEAAVDLESDPTAEDVDGVPLVPVGDDAESAMDSPIFQRLLQALGVVPPFDEQVRSSEALLLKDGYKVYGRSLIKKNL